MSFTPTPTPESTVLATADPRYAVRITPNNVGAPADKLADAEVYFTDQAGALAGTRLLGFAIWQRRSGSGLNLTMPARTYSVNGERRSFALLREQVSAPSGSTDAIKALILAAWQQYEAQAQPAQPAQPTAPATPATPAAPVRAAQQELHAL